MLQFSTCFKAKFYFSTINSLLQTKGYSRIVTKGYITIKQIFNNRRLWNRLRVYDGLSKNSITFDRHLFDSWVLLKVIYSNKVFSRCSRIRCYTRAQSFNISYIRGVCFPLALICISLFYAFTHIDVYVFRKLLVCRSSIVVGEWTQTTV